MQGNFNINLPSIPGAILKFKIQDVRLKGFLSKEARFKDNKTYLTKRFINSFPNLQSKPQHSQTPSQSDLQDKKSSASTNLSSFFHKDQQSYRIMVPNQKKNLLIKFEDFYKDYNPPILGQNKYDKGYSFAKQGLKDTLDGEMRKYQSQIVTRQEEGSKIDNYYFNQTEMSQEEEDQYIAIERRRQERLAKRKQLQPSAAFKGEERWQHNERILKNQIKLGPGEYIKQSPQFLKKSIKKKQGINPEDTKQNIKKIKEVLKDYKQYKTNSHIEVEQQIKNSPQHNTSSFIEGNLDRFGRQKYPVSFKVNIPAPGQYQTHGSLEEKAKKILILEEQRKLLKEWYNQ